MYLRSTEPDPETGARREVPLNPQHSAGIDFLWEIEGRARIGLEAFYTGRQHRSLSVSPVGAALLAIRRSASGASAAPAS